MWDEFKIMVPSIVNSCRYVTCYPASDLMNSYTNKGFRFPPKNLNKILMALVLHCCPKLASIASSSPWTARQSTWIRKSIVPRAGATMFSITLRRHISKPKWMYIWLKRLITGAICSVPKNSSHQQKPANSACASHVILWSVFSRTFFLEWLSPVPQILLTSFSLTKNNWN